MRRYVYSPKVYVYVNTGGRVGDVSNPPEIHDLTAYTTSGTVSRVINAVSSAEITIRNPRKRWTKPGKPTFRPMDPITIFMMREKGFPVQVFTGYLNRTPYYSMYPGTVTLSASCTLKRLLHKYFDPALPYTFQFLAEHGWQPNGAGGVVNLPAEAADATDGNGDDVITDSGFGKLLYATLREIGGWEDNQIYIEALPTNIASKVGNIFRQFAEEDDQALTDYQNLLQKLIGIGAEGSGGGVEGDTGDSVLVGPGSNGKKVFDYFVKRGFSDEQSAGWVGNFVQESGLRSDAVQPDGPGRGLAQWGGGRFTNLQSFASSRGTEWQNFQTQLDFVWHELQGAESVAYRAIKAARTVHAAVDAIGSKYERYGIKGNRYGPADTAFKIYAGGRGTDDDSGQGGPSGNGTLEPDRVEDAGGGSGNKLRNTYKGSPVPGQKPSAATHQTAGLSGFPAFDYMAPAGTPCVAPASGRITKLSGQSPTAGGPAGGALGYSVYLSGGGNTYFMTHIDKVTVKVGDQVEQGEQIAVVAAGPPSWSTPHVHMGVSGTANAGGSGDSTTGGSGGDSGGDGGSGDGMETSANAAAFAAILNWPSLEEMTESILMQGRRSLMNDKSLFPFIEQMTGAALRSFQSLPNGVFFAFYPDYFGEMGHRTPYWDIDDVEILDGGIDLTDDSLVTHEFVTGDTVYGGGITLFERLQSGGIVSVFNAFGATKGLPSLVPQFDGKEGPDAAIAFLQKYGARPEYTEAPMVRSPYFEAFLAYQKFMLAWSRQFATNFTFTFMPELYPGGRVGFPDHGLQCYIDSVTHSWDYTGGFTTSAVLSAPSPYGATGDALGYSSGLVRHIEGRITVSNQNTQGQGH